ncbi:TPA: IS6 family transposase [Bacillus cereus]|nr:IS6 family transposase [Bacillus cereus]HDR3914464.1 IS6 family transposase [Bacillus cereus]
MDQEGDTLDIQLRKTRDHQAAYVFMKRLLKTFGEPTVLTTDKAPALLCALKKNAFYVQTKHCTIKHLNNLIEQDHRHIKRRLVKSAGFKTFVIPHVLSKESKPFILHTNKREVISQTSLFRRTMNYKNYLGLLKLQEYFVNMFLFSNFATEPIIRYVK